MRSPTGMDAGFVGVKKLLRSPHVSYGESTRQHARKAPSLGMPRATTASLFSSETISKWRGGARLNPKSSEIGIFFCMMRLFDYPRPLGFFIRYIYGGFIFLFKM